MSNRIEKKLHTNSDVNSSGRIGENRPKPEAVVVDADASRFGGAPRFNPGQGEIIPEGSFEAKGREMFTDDSYKGLRPKVLNVLRLQYALRLEGLEIGKHGIGGWGGDGLMGKDTVKALHFLMKREGLTQDQAVAWVMDRANSKLGLGSGKPYYNPKTCAFDLERPTWMRKVAVRTSADMVKWDDASIYEYENDRKQGPRREKLEKLWKEQVEPALVRNGRSEDFIEKSRKHFFQVGAKYLRTGSGDQAQAVMGYVARVQKREERFAWVKGQWEEVAAELKKKKIATVVVAEMKKDFYGAYAHDYVYARNDREEADGKASFLREKNWVMSWNPQGKDLVA